MSAQLSDAVRAFLEEGPRFCVLATINADGTPQQSVMWYELRGDTIMMNTEASRLKARNLARDARASICVEEAYKYVTISGTVSLDATHETSQADIYALARRYNPDFKEGDYADFANQQRVTINLSIDKVVSNHL
ncbi:MAG TPA: PPOX class F420-dependent oxidoreductase [Thermomicrobiales bacterium]|nr:PPOX class F420-dependent oxidoreductase [Thermomicrobiales bacterium]